MGVATGPGAGAYGCSDDAGASRSAGPRARRGRATRRLTALLAVAALAQVAVSTGAHAAASDVDPGGGATTSAGPSQGGGTDAIGDVSVVASTTGANGITVGADGNLWVTNPTTNAVGKVTTAGATTWYYHPNLTDLGGIVSGPDGALWFTIGFGGNKIGRITTAGAITTYSSNLISIPRDIAVGVDGALWFANSGANNIGRISTGGSVTVYDNATIKAPTHIVAGPDSRLWFTNGAPGNSVGAITTTGIVTDYPSPDMSGPRDIVSGPDGALWYSDANKIGRVSTTGTVTKYDANGAGGDLAAGPDGKLWFLLGDNQLGTVTTSGTVTPHAATGIKDPRGIVAGPDGNLWVGQLHSLAKVTTDAAVTVLPGTGLYDARDQALGSDGNMWVLDGQAIDRVTPGGAATVFTGAAITDPRAIVAGPDGNLWFTNTAQNTIGRITPAGVSTSFTTAGLTAPTDLVVGPDNNLWFTSTGAVGKVTTAGVITRYVLTGTHHGIAAGPDGNLWFFRDPPPGAPNPFADIRRVTTAGAFLAPFAVGGEEPAISPKSSLVSAGGQLWFTEGQWVTGLPTGIASISTDGMLYHYTDPSLDATYPGEMALGPDGHLWFALQYYGGTTTVMRANLDGTFGTSSTLVGQYGGAGLTVGPNKTMWVLTDGLINQVIAVLAPGAPNGVSASPRALGAHVTWNAPIGETGAPITSYTVTAHPGDATCTWTSGPLACDFHGLTNGSPYTFTVKATNIVGTGPEASSGSVTPHFVDVPAGAAFYAEINWMANRGITTGYSDGTFQPAASVSRQAMAAFLYRYAGAPDGPTPTCASDPFNDVPKTSPFCGAIKWMVSTGVTTGYTDGGFHPTAPVARQAMSAFLYRFAGHPNGEHPTCASDPFVDVPMTSTFCGEIKWMSDTGISTGYAGNIFKPTNNIARQAMAAFLKRLDDLP